MDNVKKENGTCGCGRSPTGDCIGWHMLTEEEYAAKTDADKAAMFEKSENKSLYTCSSYSRSCYSK